MDANRTRLSMMKVGEIVIVRADESRIEGIGLM